MGRDDTADGTRRQGQRQKTEQRPMGRYGVADRARRQGRRLKTEQRPIERVDNLAAAHASPAAARAACAFTL
jgi:hypothetical protein